MSKKQGGRIYGIYNNRNTPAKFMNIEDTDEDISCGCTYKGVTLGYNQVTILYAPLLSGESIEALEKRFEN